jgi:hypothetical protein
MKHKGLAALGGAVATAAALAGAPAAAQAAAVAPGAPCVGGLATAGKFPVSASGFTPGGFVTVAVGNDVVASGAADAAGSFNAIGFLPFITGHQKKVELTAADDSGIAAAPASVSIVKFGVTVPSHAKPTRKVRYRAFGFLPGKRIYLFVRRHARTLGRFSLGKAKGACGDASKRMRYMPLHHYTSGTYTYYFSHSPHYSKSTRLFGFQITIFRTFG